ncbi:MAG: MATE family efflux transporter [Lachnospiraceae bacterium]|nr:MATE family efflux transporter [Lachnospiraceae bacterium]
MGRAKSRSYEIDMYSGPVLPKMLQFAVPLMLSSVLQLMFNAADVIVVGRFAGDNSLAAVGSTGTLVNFLIKFFMGFSIGGNVLVSRYYGAKQEEELRRTVHTSVTLSLISGAALTVLGVILARPLLKMLNVPAEIFDLAVLYMRIYFLGMTATMLYNFVSAILRAVGDTKRPMYYLTFAGVVNVVLNLFFVIVLHMDVAGVALATVISQCISAVLVLRCLIKAEGPMKLELNRLGVDLHKLRMIIQIGVPASIQGILFSVSNLSIQSAVNSFGATAVAGNSAAASIEGFISSAMSAFYQAVLSFTGQNIGAGHRERVNKVLLTGLGCAMTTGLVMGFGAYYFGAELLGLYTTSAAVVAMGLSRLRIMARTYFLGGMQEAVVGSMRGMGHSILPTIVSLVGICGLRVLYIATLFQMDAFHNLQSLYITFPISWGVTLAAHLVCYFWVRRRASNE